MSEAKASLIFEFYERRRRMPSYSEIMTLTGLRSKNAVFKLVNKFVEAGMLERDREGHLLPSRSFGEVPRLGVVEAGIPTVSEAADLETINLDEWLIDDRQKTYLLTVKGDSMIEAGIHEGDTVVADTKRPAKEGDIVIAEVDGGWTMKYLRYRRGKAYLQPANKKYKPIYPEFDLKIAAVVRAVIRKY